MRTASQPPKQPASSESAVTATPTAPTAPTWSDWRDGLGVVGYRPHLVKTVSIALVVGTVLFAINQLDVVLGHDATALTYLKVSLTYLVPFCVSNYGLLIATRRRQTERDGADDDG